MIDEVQVSDLALIRAAALEPCAGLTVITGETGAGKTALLSALKLLMGARASADLVRDGSERLTVSGRFFGLAPAGETALSADGPAPADDDARGLADAVPTGTVRDAAEPEPDPAAETVVVRRVGADGRSRATVNGDMASVGELARLVAPSIDLCGQLEHQQLMKVANHVKLLDAWAADQVGAPLEAYRAAFSRARAAAAELARVRDAGQLSAAKLDDARFVLKRIDEVDPQPDEYDQLRHDLSLAENAEALARAVATAHEALAGDGGSLDALGAAVSALESMGTVDPALSELATSLREAGYVLEDVAATARDYRDSVEFDPDSLAAQQERFGQLQGLLHAYGPRMEDVLARRAQAAEVVSLVDDSAARLRAAEQACAQAESALAQAADELDAARAQAAPRFAAEVGATMARLQMGGACLECSQQRLERSAWTPVGPSSFEFLYRPGAGMQARPFARIASGGEVSRVMLAVKVALGAHDKVDTLVFDEVDAGTGGAVAVALADVIADLAATHQVIVVTHLAQVAVRADCHYAVRRVEGPVGVETQLQRLDGDQRVAEIARMLSGEPTEASLAHARELLAR